MNYNKDWLKNLSSVQIPEDVNMILSLGPKFAVSQLKNEIPVNKIIADVEQIIPSFNDKENHNIIRGKAATIISQHVHKPKHLNNRKQLILHKAYINTKIFLKNHPDLTVTAADKGNITIVMDRTSYEDLMNNHFDDDKKYRKLTFNPTHTLQLKNNSIVRTLLTKDLINEKTKRQLITFTSQAPRPRAQPKIHKPGVRIIINATNSPSYNMSRFLNNILTKAGILNKYNIKNSFQLKEILNNTIIEPDEVMVSFDIISMYEKIPTQLVYKSLLKRWKYIEEITPIPWKLFKDMIKFCIEETNYVSHNDHIFKQKDGLTIGGCVSGILADFVITDLLDSAIEKAGFEPTLLVKYVDDSLAFIPKEEMENFYNILNDEDKSIQFTYELEENNQIPYLDMKVQRTPKHRIITSYYQKTTSKNRLLNYNSEHPLQQRTGVAYGTISRILKLTSIENRSTSTNRIYEILKLNGYPGKMIKGLIEKYNKIEKTQIESTKNTNKETSSKIYKGLTYTPHLSEALSKLFKKNNALLEIGFKPETTVSRIIKSPYPPLPIEERHGVIYTINCKNCDGIYIGQTGQKLKNRIKQHKADITSKTTKKNNTAVFHHSKDTGHTFDFDNTKIVTTEKNLQRRLTLETINININRSNTINLKSDIDNLNPTYTQLLNNK